MIKNKLKYLYLVTCALSLTCFFSGCGTTQASKETFPKVPLIDYSNDSFYKELLLRLVNDEILIKDRLSVNSEPYYLSAEEKVHEHHYSNKIETYEYFILDINNDGIKEIGYETCYFSYDTNDDMLVRLYDTGNMFFYGKGRVEHRYNSAGKATYRYMIIDRLYQPVITVEFSSTFNQFEDTTKYDINGIEVDKNQWDNLRDSYLQWTEDLPEPITYSELIGK